LTPGGLAPIFDLQIPVSVASEVEPNGPHATAQIVRVTRAQFSGNWNFIFFSIGRISNTVSDVLWPRYFSENCGLSLCRGDTWYMIAHTGTKLSECRPKNPQNVKFCHVQISISPPNVGQFSPKKNKNLQRRVAYKVQ